MASTPDLIGRNDMTLWAVGCILEDIHDRAPDWDASPEDERADFYFEWEGLVDRLHGVIDDDHAGALTDEQRRKLRELAQRLEAARDVILRIGLVYPDLGRLSLAS
jgi:hypothetical protein